MTREKKHNTKQLYFKKRMFNQLNNIFNYPLTILEAPMGYGKTTVIREWTVAQGVTTLWLRIYESSIDNFWKGFIKLFSQINEEVSQKLACYDFPVNSLEMEEVVACIKSLKLTEQIVLVIDDYHLTECEAINRLLEFLVLNHVNNLYITIVARYVEFSKVEEFKLKGYLYHITKEFLELNPDDIISYYKSCGVKISRREADELFVYSEGWVSALYLCMIEYVDIGTYTLEKSIYHLFDKAIYHLLSEEIKEFLVLICIFDSFTLQQANFILGSNKAGAYLNELTANNAFVVFDNRLKVFHIHSIFVGFLRDILKDKDIHFKDDLYHKAAKWFEINNNYVAARHHYYECKDFDGILSALEKDKSNNYTRANKELLKQYMTVCPQSVKKRHYYGLLIYALHLFVHREFDLFGQACVEFGKLIKSDDVISQEKRNKLLGEFELLLSFSEFNDLKKMSMRHRKAWQLLNEPTTIYNTGTNWTLGSPSVLCLYYRESGKLAEHVKDMIEALPYYYKLTNGHGFGGEYVMEAEYYYNKGDFNHAEISAQKALLKAIEKNEQYIIVSALFIQARVYFVKGQWPRVVEMMKAINEVIKNRKKNNFIDSFEKCACFMYGYLNQVNKVPERILEVDLSDRRLQSPGFPFFIIIYGRLLLIQEDYFKLIGCKDYFISASSIFPNLLGQVYTYIYCAAAYRRILQDDKAIDNLYKALDIAMPDQLYMPFVENCDYIKPVLEQIKDAGHYRKEINTILKLYIKYDKVKEHVTRNQVESKIKALTKREAEIARLASEGKSNSEIAELLFITTNTVKKTMQRIYKKLAINNRVLLKQYF